MIELPENFIIEIDHNIQTSPLGRKFIWVGLEQINVNLWIYCFKFVNTKEFFFITTDKNNTYIKRS